MSDMSRRTITDYVCTACSLMCDDLRLEIEANKIVSVEPECPLFSAMAAETVERPHPATLEGKPAELDEAIARAVEILAAARAPLIGGFVRAPVEAQRVAIEIADRLGGYCDPGFVVAGGSPGLATASMGVVTETLGEVLNRCDLAVLWDCNPDQTHPRLLPRMRRSPSVIAVEPSPGAGPAVLAVLRTLVRGVVLDDERVEATTGQPLARWVDVAACLRAAEHPVIFHESSSPFETELLTDLVHDLRAAGTQAVTFQLEKPGNVVGAAQVLTWQTGFPGCLSFARGYPEYLPFEADLRTLLGEGKIDVALLIGHDDADRWQAAAVKTIVLDEGLNQPSAAATVSLGVARFSLETTGTVFRTDGVALPMKSALTSGFPSTTEVLTQLLDELKLRTMPQQQN